MMKIFLGAAASLALAAPVTAHADTVGYVDLGYNFSDAGDEDSDGFLTGGKVTTGFSGAWNAQFDARFMRTNIEDFDFTDSVGVAHFYYQGSNWKAGGLVSVGNASFSGLYGIGVDGQYNFSNVSLTGQIAFQELDNFDESVWGIGADARMFFQDNFSGDIHVAYSDWEEDFFSTSTAMGLGLEYKFDSPVSIFADYTYTDFDDFADTNSDSFTFGVRYAFGNGTLKQRQETGPSLLTPGADTIPLGPTINLL